MVKRRANDPAILQAVRLAAVIFAPRHFVRVLRQVATANAMMDAVLGAAEPAKEALGLVRVRAVFGHVLDAVIDATHVVGGMKRIPATRFVSADRSAGSDTLPDQRNRRALAGYDERQRPAHDLAGDDDNLPLAGLFLDEPAINALGFLVLRLLAAARIHAVDVNLAGQFGAAVNFRSQHLAELVAEHEGRLVLDVEVAAQLERRMALGPVREDCNGKQVRPDRQLAAGEDRPRRHAELLVAGFALPRPARRDRPNR